MKNRARTLMCALVVGFLTFSVFSPLMNANTGLSNLSDPLLEEEHGNEQINTNGIGPINPCEENNTLFEDFHHISDVWASGYHGEDVTLAVVDTGVDFGHLDLQGTQAIVDDPASPYDGWPIAFDPHSMDTLLRTNKTEGTWYANTSRHGTGPFDLEHKIIIDGDNDFSELIELYGEDERDNDPSGDGGHKFDYDMTNLYVTRDDNFWYLGMPTYPKRAPITYGSYDFPSFGIYIDLDNETSGTSTVDPFGNYVDTLATHSDELTDIKYSPDSTMVATASKDKTVKVWANDTGNCLMTFEHTATPWALDWSPNSTTLVSVEAAYVNIWNVQTGSLIIRLHYLVDWLEIDGQDFYAQFTKTGTVSFSPNGTWVAISTKQYVYIVDVVTQSLFGKINVIGGNVNTVAFHPTNDWIAVGLGVAPGGYYQVRTYDLNTVDYTGLAIETPLYVLGNATFGGHEQQVTNLAWHPINPNTLASVCKKDRATLIVWDVTDNSTFYKENATDQSSSIYGVAWSPDGNNIVTCERGTYVEGFPAPPVISVRDNLGAPLFTTNMTLPMNSVDYDPNGGCFVTASADLRATVWSTTGTEDKIFIFHKPDYALYVDTDLRYDQKDEEWVPYMYNATFHKWDGGSSTWLDWPLNNITWPVDNETLIAAYSANQTTGVFVDATVFFNSTIVSYMIFKNGILWTQENDGDNYTVDVVKKTFSVATDADINDNDVITATYVYNTPGLQANAEWGDMLFNEFAIPRLAIGDPPAISLEVFSVGRDNATHAQDTVPADKGVYDFDFDLAEDKGLDLDIVHPVRNETVVISAVAGQTTANLANANISNTSFFSTAAQKWYNVTYELYINYDFASDENEPMPLDEYELNLTTGNITFTPPLSAGDEIRANYSYTVFSPTQSEGTSLSNFAYVEIDKYTISGITSLSGDFHFGMHPSDILSKKFGGLGLLVVDSATSNTYDKVYLDLNNDHVFDTADVVIDKTNTIAYLDNFNKTAADAGDTANRTTPDGYPDISAGMLYFIADGVTSIPYSERYCSLFDPPIDDGDNNKTPPNGVLLCFMGELDTDEDHGTKMASRLVSQGLLDTYMVKGICPESKIIAIGGKKTKANLISSWYFAVEGYDGEIGTGDEAQIIVNGFDYPTIYESGWDEYSRTADYISMSYAQENALFVMGSGDMGFGYGTVSSPGAAPGVLTVGPATDNYWRSAQANGTEGPNYYYGDVATYASRGPTAQGVPKPDCLATASGFVDVPLMTAPNGAVAYIKASPWTGSDHSCAVAAGIAALTYQAYHGANSAYPSASDAKSLLMAGADDSGYDILSQGAGFLNANRSVAMAAGEAGLSTSHDFWVPGDYEGNSYDAFASLAEPGETFSDTIDIINHGPSTVNVEISDFVFDKLDEVIYTNCTTDKISHYTEMGAILGATLNVRYSAGTGYSGTNYVRWALDGQSLTDTAICPEAGHINQDASYDLFIHGVNTIEDVSTLDIEFTNNDNDDDVLSSVSFDIVNVTVSYRTTELGNETSWVTSFNAISNVKGPLDNTTDDLADVQAVDALGASPGNVMVADGWYTIESVITLSIDNETVDTTTDGDHGKFCSLDHGDIVNCTIYLSNATGAWNESSGVTDYLLNYTTGELDWQWTFNAPITIYAYYNYTSKNTAMFLDGFDMSPMGTSEQYIFAVMLDVRYSVDDGYNGTVKISNETVYGPATGGEIGLFCDLYHWNILNCTIYYDSPTDNWIKAQEGVNYSLNYSSGGITWLSPALNPDTMIYSFYNHTPSVAWALHGQPLQDTYMAPQAGQVGQSDSYDLYTLGVDTIREISTLDIGFTNNDGGPGYDTVSFDYVGLIVKYRGLTGLQYLGNPIMKGDIPPLPNEETVETLKSVCNLIGQNDTTGDVIEDIQVKDENGPTPGEVHENDNLYTVSYGYNMFLEGFTTVMESVEDDWYSPGEIAMWLNDTGLHRVDPHLADVVDNYPSTFAGSPLPPGMNFMGSFAVTPQTLIPTTPGLWENASMIRITAYSNFSTFSMMESNSFNYSYLLSLMDWEWNGSYYGGNTSYPVYFPCPSSKAQINMQFPDDLNTISQTIITSNVLECRVSNPAGRIHDGLVIHLEPFSDDLKEEHTEWTFKIEYFKKADWNWLEIDGQAGMVPLTVPTTGSSFPVTMNVPSHIGVGSYQGGIQIKDTSSGTVTTIPVLVNVASPRDDFEFGGNWPTYNDVYNNTLILGGYDMTLKSGVISKERPYTGDRRFYYFNIPNQGIYANLDDLNMKAIIEADWNEKPSDIDILLLSRKKVADDASKQDANRYGSYTLENKGGSEEISEPEFNTITNISEEVVALDLTPGLNVIVLRGLILNGSESHETVTGYSCEVSVTPSLDIVTSQVAGSAPVYFHSNRDWAGVNASAVGPAITENYEDLEIPQDYQSWWNYPNWGEWMMRGSGTYWVNLTKCLILEVHLVGHYDCPDLDLAVFQDLNGDGELTIDEVTDDLCIKRGGVNWDYDADADADETVKWVAPPDGPYIIKVLGFTTTSRISSGEQGGHFDLDISQTLDTGKGYELDGTNENDIVEETLPILSAHQETSFDIVWNFPGDTGDGNYGGAVMIGTTTAPGLIVIPVTISLDTMAPNIASISPADGSIINNDRPTISAAITDYERAEIAGASILLDGLDITNLASVIITFDGDAKGAGYPLGTVIYKPNAPLKEGYHRVDLTVYDWADNNSTVTWIFTVDLTAPHLEIETPPSPTTYVNEAELTIIGTAESGSMISVLGVPSQLYQWDDGSFTATITLSNGDNLITVRAVDSAGNTAEIQRNIILDTETPEFDRVIWLDGTLTNKKVTGIYGEMSERGTLTINSRDVAVSGDGSFRAENIDLEEGVNQFTLEFTDLAGNVATRDMTITLDTIAPVLSIDAVDNRISTEWLNVSGTIDADATLYINGKLIDISSTRQGTGEFEHTVRLSYGANTIVIESKDRAGNVAQEILSVSYELEGGTNWGAIGLMIVLLVVGLFVGILITRLLFGIPAEEEYDEELEGELEPEKGEEFPEMEGEALEEAPPEELEELPEEDIKAEEEPPEIDEEAPLDEVPPDDEAPRDLEDIPSEKLEDMPPEELEDMPPEQLEERAPEEPEIAEDEIPEEDLEAEPEPVEEEQPEAEAEEEVSEELESIDEAEPEAPEEEAIPEGEDPRVAKLTQAYENGKISKELYEKNLAKFKES